MKRTGEQAFGPVAEGEAEAGETQAGEPELEPGEVAACVNVLPEDMRHLYDTVMVHRAPDGAVTEFRCAALKLHAASAMMREAMRDTDTTIRNGRRMYQVPREANVSAQAFGDALTFIHRDGEKMPDDLERRLAMLGVLEWLDALQCERWAVADVVKRALQGMDVTRADHLDLLDGLSRHVKATLPDVIFQQATCCDCGGVEEKMRLGWTLYDIVGRVCVAPSRPDVLDWLATVGDPDAVDRALEFTCALMPPVLVAITLARRGLLTPERYAVVVETTDTRWPAPDYLALAKFTPLVKARQPEKLTGMIGVRSMVAMHRSSRYDAFSVWLTVARTKDGTRSRCGAVIYDANVGQIKAYDNGRTIKWWPPVKNDGLTLFAMDSRSDLRRVQQEEETQLLHAADTPATSRLFPSDALYFLVMRGPM